MSQLPALCIPQRRVHTANNNTLILFPKHCSKRDKIDSARQRETLGCCKQGCMVSASVNFSISPRLCFGDGGASDIQTDAGILISLIE